MVRNSRVYKSYWKDFDEKEAKRLKDIEDEKKRMLKKVRKIKGKIDKKR